MVTDVSCGTSAREDGGHEVAKALDGKTPSSPAATPGTPQIAHTPTALFPGSPIPCKGLGIMFRAGEDVETEEERRPGEDEETESQGLGITYGAGEKDETESLDQERKEAEDAEDAYYRSSPQWDMRCARHIAMLKLCEQARHESGTQVNETTITMAQNDQRRLHRPAGPRQEIHSRGPQEI